MEKKELLNAWRAVNEARAKLDLAAQEGRELSAEERAVVDAALTDGSNIASAAQAEKERSRLDDISAALEGEVEVPRTKALTKPLEMDAYVSSFKAYLRGDTKAAGDLQEGNDPEGGYIVPPEFMARLVRKLDPAAPMLPLCSSFNASTNVVEIPKLTGVGFAGWTAEEAGYTEETIPFGTMSITVHKATRLQKVSEELLADSAFDVEGLLADVFGVTFGTLINTALTTGTGTAQPYGFVTQNTSINQCADSGGWVTDFDPDVLIEMSRSDVPVGYWGRCRWVMNQGSWATLAKKKDADERYLLLPASQGGLEGGVAGTLLGYPITLNPAMAAMASDAKSIAFGDFSAHYVVRRPGMTIRRLGELYAANGQVGFVMNLRLGAALSIVDEPIVIGQNATS